MASGADAPAAFRAYLRDLRATRATGRATEHSYRPAVRALIEALGGAGAEAVNEPSHGEYGASDRRLSRASGPACEAPPPPSAHASRAAGGAP